MLVVVALISLMVGISFPAITSGIDSLRLNAATNGVVSFLDSGLSRAERRQQVVEITISKADNSLEMRSSEPGFFRKLQMPEGVSIVQVLPPLPDNPDATAQFPALSRRHRAPAGLAIDQSPERPARGAGGPITGVPHVEAAAPSMKRQRGFTLLEVMVATLIMAIAVAGLMCGHLHFSAQRRAAHRSRSRRSARPSEDGRTAGRHRARKGRAVPRHLGPGGHRWQRMGWRARLTPFEVPQGRRRPARPFIERVELEIWWMNGSQRRSFSLEGFIGRSVIDAGRSWQAMGSQGMSVGVRTSHDRAHIRRRAPTAGVTLMELLIAVLLLSLLSVGIVITLRVALSAMNKIGLQADGQPASLQRGAHSRPGNRGNHAGDRRLPGRGRAWSEPR